MVFLSLTGLLVKMFACSFVFILYMYDISMAISVEISHVCVHMIPLSRWFCCGVQGQVQSC